MKKRLFFAIILAVLFIFSGCGKNADSGTDADTNGLTQSGSTQSPASPTLEQKPSPVQNGDRPDNKTTQEPSQEISPEVTPTGETTPEATPEPTGETAEPTKGGDGQDDKTSDGNDIETVRGYWNDSFLVWLPIFETGSFESFASDETHDYIKLGDIKADAVETYIDTLVRSGFGINRTYTDSKGNVTANAGEGSFRYIADNDDGWRVSLDYDVNGKTLVIGSGYETIQTEDAYEKLRKETALGYLPEFSYGEYDSAIQDEDMQYVIFTAVEADCRTYIGQIKEAGFTIDADEGDGDGILWYNASDAEGHVCEFIYSDGMVKIGCGM